MERYLFLLLGLLGAVACYYDQDLLLNNWIGPSIVAGPLIAWAIVSFTTSKEKKDDEKEKKGAETPQKVEEPPQPEKAAAGTAREMEQRSQSLEDIQQYAQDLRAEGAMWILSVLQREGRLIDFVKEDITPYDDAQVGAAVRQIHKGLSTAFEDVLKLAPVLDADEGAEVEIEQDYDPKRIKLTGKLTGSPPYKGYVVHPGWRVDALKVPEIKDPNAIRIICKADIEVA